jgi:hypothetical protein
MKVGFLGAGAVAQAYARVLLNQGHEVLLRDSRGAHSLAGVVARIGPVDRRR